MIKDIISINVVSDEGTGENSYDFSTLNEVSNCPFKGILRNVLGKRFNEGEHRNTALEAGDLCHKVYAIWRALSIKDSELQEYYTKKFMNQVIPEADEGTITIIYSLIKKQTTNQLTPVSKYMVYADWVIENSGYYDDDTDKKRTIENIRTSLSAYCRNFLDLVESEPVWISKDKQQVGIELPFKCIIKINYTDINNNSVYIDVPFIGKIDGIHVHNNGKLIIHENKTASRLDDSWLNQWYMSHQITGYCLASSLFTNEFVDQARVLGMQIPVPKVSGYAFRTERVDRSHHFISNWARWVVHQVKIIEDYKDCVEIAPMNTKACCAFYSTCPLMCLCTLDNDERKYNIDNMVTDKWSPLNE